MKPAGDRSEFWQERRHKTRNSDRNRAVPSSIRLSLILFGTDFLLSLQLYSESRVDLLASAHKSMSRALQTTLATKAAGRRWMSSKRRGQEGEHSGRRGHGGNKRPRHRNRKQLYLVLDDWANGFSVHKMDADTLDDEAGGTATGKHHHLPEPVLLRLEFAHASGSQRPPHDGMSVSAMGTKIFVLMNHRCALIYDTETAALSNGAHATAEMNCGSGITVSVPANGGMLYALSYRSDEQHSFQVMSSVGGLGSRYSWKTLPPPPPTFTSCQRVVSYALHPDGCTIFMTTAHAGTPGDPLGTYSFNTKHSEWRWHGDWALPFLDRAHFDSKLDAWVGLHRDGYICSCQVASRSRCSGDKATLHLDWQLTKEKLFFSEDWEAHLDVSLTYMGTSKFCLVETTPREGMEEGYLGDQHGSVLRLTIFGLKYNHKGELHITNRRSTHSYLVSRHTNYFVPFAFWM